MPFPTPRPLDPGGKLRLEYRNSVTGDHHASYMHVAQFDQTPIGPDNDYFYNGAGQVSPAEASILDTFTALANLWKAYYSSDWSLNVVDLMFSIGENYETMPLSPIAAPVHGTAGAPPTNSTSVKRVFTLFSANGIRRRLWLKQMLDNEQSIALEVDSTSGGIDARDQAWMAYLTGATGGGAVAPDGTRFRNSAVVSRLLDRIYSSGVPGGSAVDGSGQLSTPCLTFLAHGAAICNPSPDLVTITSPNTYDFDATGITLPGGGRLEG